MPRPELVVASGDVRIAVRDYGGEGPDLLLTHGAGDNLRSLGGVIPHLRPHHRVVAYDIRGHGWSDEAPTFTADDHVADAEAVIAAMGMQNPFFAGHSLGGMIAAFYGAAHPDCPGVTNIDGHGRGGPSVPPSIRVRLEQMALTAPQPGADHGDADWFERQLAQRKQVVEAVGVPWSAAEGNARRNFVLESDGKFHRRPSIRMMKVLGDEIGSWKLFDLYRQVKCPLQIFQCTKVVPGAIAVEIMEELRQSLSQDLDQLVADRPGTVISPMDTTHNVVVEDPAGLAANLLGFFGS